MGEGIAGQAVSLRTKERLLAVSSRPLCRMPITVLIETPAATHLGFVSHSSLSDTSVVLMRRRFVFEGGMVISLAGGRTIVPTSGPGIKYPMLRIGKLRPIHGIRLSASGEVHPGPWLELGWRCRLPSRGTAFGIAIVDVSLRCSVRISGIAIPLRVVLWFILQRLGTGPSTSGFRARSPANKAHVGQTLNTSVATRKRDLALEGLSSRSRTRFESCRRTGR